MSVRAEDSGVYECRASNSIGEAVTTAQAKIKCEFLIPLIAELVCQILKNISEILTLKYYCTEKNRRSG